MEDFEACLIFVPTKKKAMKKHQTYFIPKGEYKVVQETEKAIKIEANYGGDKQSANKLTPKSKYVFWSPKSCIKDVFAGGDDVIGIDVASFVVDEKLNKSKGYQWIGLRKQLSKCGCFGHRTPQRIVKYQ